MDADLAVQRKGDGGQRENCREQGEFHTGRVNGLAGLNFINLRATTQSISKIPKIAWSASQLSNLAMNRCTLGGLVDRVVSICYSGFEL